MQRERGFLRLNKEIDIANASTSTAQTKITSYMKKEQVLAEK